MPTQTETSVAKLKINRLTQSQFDSATTQANELYLVDPEFTGGKLLETDASGNIVESTATIPSIDQTFDGTSANAQSGVAINGAGFLKNTASTPSTGVTINTTNNTSVISATGGSVVKSDGYSVGVGYNPTVNNSYSVSMGYVCKSGQYCIAIGNNASANYSNGYYSIAIGSSTSSNGVKAQGLYSIAIGYNAVAGAHYAVSLGGDANASSQYSTALGNSANATASYAIQLGKGTNSTANTLSVGLSDSNNYTLLNSDGTIPAGRLPIATSVDSTSTNAQVVGAQLFYDTCGDIETLINAL